MSTKTTFKRIALVAVAALGLSVVSVAPSNAAVNVGLFAFVNKSSTVSVNSAAAVALSAVTSSNAPGVSYTANGAITNSVATITAPASSVFAFKLTAGNAGTWSAATEVRVATGGSTLGQLACTISTVTCTLADFTAPATAGTYPLELKISGASTSFAAADVESISITLIVTAANNGLPELSTTSAYATDNANYVSSVSVRNVYPSGRVGIAAGFVPVFKVTNVDTDGTKVDYSASASKATIAYSITKPTGSASALLVGTTASSSQSVTAANAITGVNSTSTAGSTEVGASVVTFTPDVAGTYTITAWHDANANGVVDSGEANGTGSFVIAADATPSITFTQYGSALGNDGGNGAIGKLVKISLKNGTAAAGLSSVESISLSSNSSTFKFDAKAAWVSNAFTANQDAAETTTLTLTRANFNGNGDAYVNVVDTLTGGETVVLTATGAGSANASAASNTASVVFGSNATYAPELRNAAITIGNTTGVAAMTCAAITGTSAANRTCATTIATGVSTAVKFATTNSAVSKAQVAKIVDTYGLITGLAGAEYRVYAVTASDAVSPFDVSFTMPAVALSVAAPSYQFVLKGQDNQGTPAANTTTITVSAATPAAASISLVGAAAATPTSLALRGAIAGSYSVSGTVLDQFGNALSGITVTPAITGRNATTTVATTLSSATGLVTYSWTDASTSVVNYTDSVSLSTLAAQSLGGTAKTATATMTYAASVKPATVLVKGPDYTATSTGGAMTMKDINAGDGAEGTLQTVTATLKDASGATLPAGIAVTFTSTAGSAVTSTTATAYTDASGVATAKVYAWIAGTHTITATSGGVTGSDKILFGQTGTPTEVRTIAATVSSDNRRVLVTAKDRFGNVMSGVSVYASSTGGGYIASVSPATTDANGVAQFNITPGTDDTIVTVSVVNPALAAGTTYGQSCAAVGYITCGYTATLVGPLTAYVAGTAATDEYGVGSTFAAAGVASAVVTVVADQTAQAAVDAAAEATDAANAATDAANAAAEAADAATAAAQDAADAVAALSTQVSEMIDALKKQITALTNLVIKIQKKVKA